MLREYRINSLLKCSSDVSGWCVGDKFKPVKILLSVADVLGVNLRIRWKFFARSGLVVSMDGKVDTSATRSHVQLLLDSFARLLGRELIARTGTAAEQAERLFQAPFVVVSHGTEADPILNYGNAAALALWEMPWEAFTQTPSRLTAEPMHRDERARLLARTREHGYVDDYAGIRIAGSGRRFRIEQAIVWNLTGPTGNHRGQAATFSRWTLLEM